MKATGILLAIFSHRLIFSVSALLLTCSNLSAGDFIHHPSGITFPAKMERFTLGPIDDGATDAKSVDFYYLYPDGQRVIVKVFPGPKDAHGPTLLDGDSKSDASPAFMKAFEKIKNKVLKTDDSIAVHAQMRFLAAPQLGGVLGMKVTLAGAKMNTDLSLFERNGYFVSISVTYPADQWMAYGLTYTDVAHFTKWPPSTKD